MPSECPRVFELPRDAIYEVPIRHPTYEWFMDLNLKWHALPAVSDMQFIVVNTQRTINAILSCLYNRQATIQRRKVL